MIRAAGVAESSTPTNDTSAVRSAEQLDWPRIAEYLRDRLPQQQISDFDLSSPMEVQQFHGGHSNLTYLLRFGRL